MDPPWYIQPVEIRPDLPVIRLALSVMDTLYGWEQDGLPDVDPLLDVAESVTRIRWQLGQDGNGPSYPLHVLIERARERGWRIVLPTEMRQPMTAQTRVRFDNIGRRMEAFGWYPVLSGGNVANDPFWHWPAHPAGPRLATVAASLAQLRHGVTQLVLPWACDREVAPPIPSRLLHPMQTLRERLRRLPSLAAFARRTHFPYASLHRLRADGEDATATVPLVHALANALGYGIRWMPGRPAA